MVDIVDQKGVQVVMRGGGGAWKLFRHGGVPVSGALYLRSGVISVALFF